MSDKPVPPYLSVASEYSAADYPYSFTDRLANVKDHIARAHSLTAMRGAANMAGITDYKLFEEYDGNAIYLRDFRDVRRYKIATQPGDGVMGEFFTAEHTCDVRKLKRICNTLQKMTDKAGFGDAILFELDRRARCIYYQAESKRAYFAFDDFVEQNRAILQPFLNLQRKEPEIPFPTEDEATPVTINYVEDLDDDINFIRQETEADPKSMGITPGGKAEGEEKSKDRSHLSLVKSFEPRMHGYNFKLTPKIVYDPEKSKTDALFRHLPDYPEFKIATKTKWVMEQIRLAMQQAEVGDYYLNDGPQGIEAWFKTPEDLAVAYASIMPDSVYQVDFLHCSPHTSPMKICKKAKRIQKIFAATGENVNVKFVADKERCVIQAVMQSSSDFIRVQGLSRRLERTNQKFQSLIGLEMNLTP